MNLVPDNEDLFCADLVTECESGTPMTSTLKHQIATEGEATRFSTFQFVRITRRQQNPLLI